MDENPITKFDINDESENIKLPPINLKLIPPQKNINDLSKNENEDEKKFKYIKSQTFITSKKTETERFEEVKSKNLISNEAISDLLKEKIEINNTLNYDRIIIDNFYKPKIKTEIKRKKKINKYINEDILINSPIRINRNKKLKQIKVNNLFTEMDEFEQSKNDESSNFDKRLYNLRLNNFIKESKEAKKIKSVVKKNIKKNELSFVKSNWKKNINCSLDYRYAVNKYTMEGLNSLIHSMAKRSKHYFDVFKAESNDVLEKIWNPQ